MPPFTHLWASLAPDSSALVTHSPIDSSSHLCEIVPTMGRVAHDNFVGDLRMDGAICRRCPSESPGDAAADPCFVLQNTVIGWISSPCRDHRLAGLRAVCNCREHPGVNRFAGGYEASAANNLIMEGA